MDGQTFTKQNEGCRLSAYEDTLGNWTIGYGHTGPEVTDGLIWTQAECETAFEDDYQQAITRAHDDVGNICWVSLNETRQAALTDMAFEMGGKGLAQFKAMIGYLTHNDFQAASAAALNSKWANEVPVRAKRVALILETGEWPVNA